MPVTFQNEEYLNTKEAAEFFRVSFITFMKMRDKTGMQTFSIPGKGNAKFHKRTDLEKLQAPQASEPQK